MAKPLNERIASARSTDRVTIHTLRDLIAETRAERERQAGRHASADADSTDIALNETDRDEAAATAARAGRLVKAYNEALHDLEAKLERKLESEHAKAAEAERAAALAERDEIAVRFREFVPSAIETLIHLSEATNANRARMMAAGLQERDAEAEARGIPGNFYDRNAPIEQFTKLKIPNWSSPGRQWPADRAAQARAIELAEAESQRYAASARQRTPEAIAARKAAEEAQYARYLVQQKPYSGAMRGPFRHRHGISMVANIPVPAEMTKAHVRLAREQGFSVEPAPADAKAAQ
jgi:hypothetical protein